VDDGTPGSARPPVTLPATMPTELFTFADLLTRLVPDFDGRRWKVIRHLDRSADAPDLVELFHTNRAAIEFYQTYQGRDIFRNCDGFFSFLGLPGGRARFMGAYRVEGPGQAVLLPEANDPLVPSAFRSMWRRWKVAENGVAQNFRYGIVRDPRFQPLEMRPVIAWGAGERAWHQWDLSKPVLELRQPGEIGACPCWFRKLWPVVSRNSGRI